MSQLLVNPITQPAAPSGSISSIYKDSADGRLKILDPTGRVDVIQDKSLYNYLVNGGFDFCQRWPVALTTNTQSTSGRQINPDRWGLTAQTASAQYARNDTSTSPATNLTARYYGQFKQVTGAGKICVSQVLETKDVMAMRGRTVRIQFKIRYSANASLTNYRIGALQLTSAGTADTMPATFISAFNANSTDPTWGTNLTPIIPTLPTSGSGGASPNGTIVGNFMTIVPTANFVLVTCCVLVPTNCLNLVVVVFSDSQLSVGDDCQLSEASLTIGQEVNDWNPLSMAEENQRIAWWYEKSFPRDTAPVQSAGTNTGEVQGIAGKAGATAELIHVRYKSKKRAAPTVTLYNPSAANAQVRDETAAGDCSASTVANSTEDAFSVTATGNSSTAVGGTLGVHFTADAEI